MGQNQDPGSGINIPDPQHCLVSKHFTKYVLFFSYRQALLRAMARVKATPFTSNDILYLKEYAKVMEPVAIALDKLQGEEQAYLGCLLPTVAVTLMRLEDARTRHLMFCDPLVRALLDGIRKRFGPLFEDRECQLAAGFHPRFRLIWLQKHDAMQVRRVKQAMEEAVEECLKEAADMTASSSDSSSDDVLQEEDFYGAVTQAPRETSRRTSHKTNAVRMVANWLAGPSKKDFVEAFMGEPVLSKLFVKFNTPVPSSAAVERFFSQGKDIWSTQYRRTGRPNNFRSNFRSELN